MKIAPATKPTRTTLPIGDYKPGPPLTIDHRGVVQAILDAPTTDAAWLALVDRCPPGGHVVAARLTACTSRVQDAYTNIEAALQHVGQRRRDNPGEPLPPAWIARLCDLYEERFCALTALDDAAHDGAALSPRWVATLPCVHGEGDDRPVPSTEVSWARIARLMERALEGLTTLTSVDAAWELLEGMEADRDASEGDVLAVRRRGVAVVRGAARDAFGGTK